MLPGFINLYIKDNKIHLFFFRGLTDDGRYYYNRLNLKDSNFKYDKIDYDDESCEYIFYDNSIKRIKCTLINYN